MLVLIALLDLELEQVDVNTTFLHGDLNEDIYIYGTTIRVFSKSQQEVCLKAQEGSVWTEAISQTMVQEV